MIEEVDIGCPYCGATFVTLVDCSAGAQRYTEDCQVCCQPIVFEVAVGAEGALEGVDVHREDD